ncbi:MAG: hypothetical protein QG549_183 [Patescibacteria group bacterium]|nr:hypothetical protein [Patescibacteria group bacterium]
MPANITVITAIDVMNSVPYNARNRSDLVANMPISSNAQTNISISGISYMLTLAINRWNVLSRASLSAPDDHHYIRQINNYLALSILCDIVCVYMSQFEKFYRDELEPYEQDVDNHNEFIESWISFRDKEDRMLHTLSLTMSGDAGSTWPEVIDAVETIKYEYIEDLEALSEVIFDTIERDEAVKIWANVIDQTLRARLRLMTFIDTNTAFELPPMSELETNAAAYGAGHERARVDGLLESANEPTDDEHYEQIGIERLHEILADDDIEWNDLSVVSEGDEYAEWVLDEIIENLEQHITDLLDTAPRELYKE